jgi:predicted ester cyclase
MPANGKIIAFSAASIWIIYRGKIIEQTTMVDLAGLQRQLNS